jgi:hypothetical protein
VAVSILGLKAILEAYDAVIGVWILCIRNKVTSTNKLESLTSSNTLHGRLQLAPRQGLARIHVEIIVKGLALGHG